MTPKQIERIQAKIKKIRKKLAAERQKFGCYDDSGGWRYAPPKLYIKIEDYKGGATYLRWFHKNFPDDIGFPIFNFERAIILFKNGKLQEAESKIFETFFGNIYYIDTFFERPLQSMENHAISSWNDVAYAEYMTYSKNQQDLCDFTQWLERIETSEKFINVTNTYISLMKQCDTETNNTKRLAVLSEIYALKESVSC